MALHPDNCELCQRIEACRLGLDDGLVAEMETGWAVMGPVQYFRGYCLLIAKSPASDLEDLPRPDRQKFLLEMMMLSEAIASAVRPHKMNLESLGNQVPHLHWHLFPRQLEEPGRLLPVWVTLPAPEQLDSYRFSAARHGTLRDSIRAALLALG